MSTGCPPSVEAWSTDLATSVAIIAWAAAGCGSAAVASAVGIRDLGLAGGSTVDSGNAITMKCTASLKNVRLCRESKLKVSFAIRIAR